MSVEKTQVLPRILIVDDTKTDRDLFKYLLKGSGFDVEVAADGIQALELMEKIDFDLVLCDYLMPNLDGYGFLLKVRRNPKFSHVIVISITSDESDDTKTKLLNAGVNDFVRKGDSHDEIIARMRVHLNAQAALADLKVLEMACALTDRINQPLSVFIAALDLLKEKIRTELPEANQQDFHELLKTLDKEADSMIAISEGLKKLSMDTNKRYKFKNRLP